MKRQKGKTVPQDKVKYQFRIYIKPTVTFDFLPVWWKYYALGTSSRTSSDRLSYAVKWLCLEFHIESVRMKRRQ